MPGMTGAGPPRNISCDEFIRRTQLALGQPSARGTFVHLYLNGLYWGLYNLTERPVESFCATYFGGEKEEWEATNSGEGNLPTWNAMLSLVRQGMETQRQLPAAPGQQSGRDAQPRVQRPARCRQLHRLHVLQLLGGTGDWPHHNCYAACRRPPNSTGFKFFNWDAEGTLVVWSSLTANVTNVTDGAGDPVCRLWARTRSSACSSPTRAEASVQQRADDLRPLL